jgi:hypothetical protein
MKDSGDKKAWRFIFHIESSDSKPSSHNRLKLYEAYYKVLTQQILSKTMAEGSQTIKNIAMKMNTKTLGLCFIPEYDASLKEYSLEHNNDLLIIGYDVSHPKNLSGREKFDLKKKDETLENRHPSVVGICANKMTAKWGFAGDFFYVSEILASFLNPYFSSKLAKKLSVHSVLLKLSRVLPKSSPKRDAPQSELSYCVTVSPKANIKWPTTTNCLQFDKEFWTLIRL